MYLKYILAKIAPVPGFLMGRTLFSTVWRVISDQKLLSSACVVRRIANPVGQVPNGTFAINEMQLLVESQLYTGCSRKHNICLLSSI
jgi:hypothetical protein